MTTSETRRFPLGLTLAAVIGVGLLIGLGVWQLQRLAWKTDLLARVAAAQTAPPVPLASLTAAAARGADLDYRRVALSCPRRGGYARLYALKDGQIGYRVITACELDCAAAAPPYGAALIDWGFVADTDVPKLARTMAPNPPDPIKPFRPCEMGRFELVGVLRKAEGRSPVSAPDQPAAGLWYTRDLAGMAKRLSPNTRTFPYFVTVERVSPALPEPPTPAPLPTDIPNRHLEYALTWFGLAAALAGVYLAVLLRRLKTR